VDTKPNCGNMLAGVGPFAIEAGLVRAGSPETMVRIFNVNTQTLVEAIIQTPGGSVEYSGDTRIDGVAEAAAPIKLTFLDAFGAVTGKLLPTGQVVDLIDGVEASCVDMAMPVMIIAAEALGKNGGETPEELDADRALWSASSPSGGRRAGAWAWGTSRSSSFRSPCSCPGRKTEAASARAISRRSPATDRTR